MTLKLPYRSPWPSIRRAREVIDPSYEVVAIRHLPHNRREVTARCASDEPRTLPPAPYFLKVYILGGLPDRVPFRGDGSSGVPRWERGSS